MNTASILGILSLVITFSIFLSNVIFRTGHLTARVEALEQWKSSMRNDMHEVSDRLIEVTTELKQLHVLIEERTERRVISSLDRDKG